MLPNFSLLFLSIFSLAFKGALQKERGIYPRKFVKTKNGNPFLRKRINAYGTNNSNKRRGN